MFARASLVSSMWLRISALRAVRSAARPATQWVEFASKYLWIDMTQDGTQFHSGVPVSICWASIASRAKIRCCPLASASCACSSICLKVAPQPRSHHLQATMRSSQSPVIWACIAFLGTSIPHPSTHGTGLYSQLRECVSTSARLSSVWQPCLRWRHCDGHNAHCI